MDMMINLCQGEWEQNSLISLKMKRVNWTIKLLFFNLIFNHVTLKTPLNLKFKPLS